MVFRESRGKGRSQLMFMVTIGTKSSNMFEAEKSITVYCLE